MSSFLIYITSDRRAPVACRHCLSSRSDFTMAGVASRSGSWFSIWENRILCGAREMWPEKRARELLGAASGGPLSSFLTVSALGRVIRHLGGTITWHAV